MPRPLAATGGITFVFSSCRYWDVSVPCVRPGQLVAGIIADGLPHSDTRGSTAACASPRRFAACCVLPRLLEPRYPPSALAFFSFLRQALLTGGVLVSLSLLSSECQWSLSPPCGGFAPRTPPRRITGFFMTGGILYFLVENKGVEPLTPCLQGRCSKPTELIPRSPVQS